MGNACTIHNTTSLPSNKSPSSTSLAYPPIPDFLQEIYSQYKIDCFSHLNSQSISTSTLPLPTINATKSYKRSLYTVNKQNLNKAIHEQASPAPSPSKKAALKSTFQFMKLSSNANQLSKEKWSKESSFIRQNPPSFHTSVSEIYDDGYMEYSRDSESLKVEDLWQDVSRTGNSDLQKGLSERLAQHNLDDRRRSDSYLTAVQEGFAGKIINVEDYRRGSVEGPLQNNLSPPKKNLKKEEVKMFQFRVEKEEGIAKIPMFGKAENDSPPQRVKEVLEKRHENYILNSNAQGTEAQQQISSQNEKEMRMAKSLTTVARSFSPVRRSQNVSPEAKSEENPFREEKSLYSESVSPFEISPMRMQADLSPSRKPTDRPVENYYSASKLTQSGFKPLVKYCSVGNLEPAAQATGLYDGIHNIPKGNQPTFKGTSAVSDADKLYSSVQLYPSENYNNDVTDRSKRDFGARKSSLMDRLMESLLEDRIRKEEPKAILEAVEKETPSPSVREKSFEKEKSSSYEPGKFEFYSKQKLDYTADQSDMSRLTGYKQTATAQENNNNIRFLEKTKSVTSNILKEMDKDISINPFKRSEKALEQANKDSRETHNSLVSSAQVSRGASPHLKSEMLDVSRELILTQMEEAQKMLKAKEKRATENSFQKERGEIVTDQKAIVQEIKHLQKEVFDRMSVVTSNMKGKMLTPKKMLELKDIQDKIKILTQLGTMIEAEKTGETGLTKQNKESISQSALVRRSFSNMKERSIPPKAESQQKSNRSFSKEARNYVSCSKPSTTTSQTASQNIKRNSSMTNINANVSTKNTYTSKPVSHQSTEPDTSLVIKPPSAAHSECKSTQEFLETENECIQNPKEVWKRPNSESLNLKPSKTVSYSSEPKSSHKHLTPFPAKELEPYQSVEPRPRRVTEVLSSSKSYIAHDLSLANYSSVAISNKDSSSQHYTSTEKKDNSSSAGIQNMIKKLTQPKNLSTYATPPQVQQQQQPLQQKPAYRYATVESTSNQQYQKNVKQYDTVARRLSTGGEKPDNRKPNSYKEITSKSRVSSVEKIKPAAPVPEKHVPLIKNESQNQLKNNSSNKRLSVGSNSAIVKEYSMSLTDYRDKSPAPKRPVENDKKLKNDKSLKALENNENVLGTPLDTIMNDSKCESDQADLLYEEITKLDQKLAVTKSTGKMPLPEEPMEKSPNRRVRPSESSLERANKGGSYIKQAARKSERHFTPLMGRVNRQNHNQSTEICERRLTVTNLSVQQEQIEAQMVSEVPSEDVKKGGKYNYQQSMQMRIKFAEEAARRQSVAESTEWILNAKLPLFAGKIQDKAKKNQG